MVLDGIERPVSHIDIRVPSEHSVDGRSSAMELQLFHVPQDDNPVVAISLLFDVAEEPNEWLQPLADAVPLFDMKKETRGLWLNQVHPTLSGVSTTQYYHYDGTMTSAPCRRTSWLVLREVGHIGVDQLAVLKHALQQTSLSHERQRFKAAFVTLGTQRSIDGISPKGL